MTLTGLITGGLTRSIQNRANLRLIRQGGGASDWFLEVRQVSSRRDILFSQCL